MQNQQSQTNQSQTKPYQRFLAFDSTVAVINQRRFLTVKLLCVDLEWRKQTYRDCIQNLDDALQQVFDLYYRDTPDEERIDDLLAFWTHIDQQM